jgi:enoyl-CoA hydratase/carnithine racemase
MNLLGPVLVRDLVSLIQHAEGDDTCQVLVFRSADPEHFISHVDVTRISEYRPRLPHSPASHRSVSCFAASA